MTKLLIFMSFDFLHFIVSAVILPLHGFALFEIIVFPNKSGLVIGMELKV